MEKFVNILQKIFMFDKEPQRIGLSQFKEPEIKPEKKDVSIKNKNVKLSDLMRRDSSVSTTTDVNIWGYWKPLVFLTNSFSK